MLTFSFTGVDGTMTECETLTSGMVGKQVQLLFDDSWDALSKTVVFRAADINRVVINPESSLVVIPEAVLARPFGKLFVGVYGTDENGTVIIPTIMAEGPMIRYGADPIEDETAKELPVWENLQNQIGDPAALATEEKENLTGAINELHARSVSLEANVEQIQETVSYLGEPMLLETEDKTSLVGAVNEVHRQETVLETTVEQMQENVALLGDPALLETEDKSSLVGAVNEIHRREVSLEAEAEQLQAEISLLGDPALLETDHKASLVGAVNEVHREMDELSQSGMMLTAAAAQLLVDILSKGTYADSQEEAIAALAEAWGVDAPEKKPDPILFWDFRTGSLTDQITGAAATAASDVTMDESGAYLPSKTSYIMFPAGLDGASLAGHTLEVKFGQMSLSTSALTLRLASTCMGNQPASVGISWNALDFWSTSAAIETEYTDLNMFSGKTLYAKGATDSTRIEWYCEDQLIGTTEPDTANTHVSIGSTSNGAFPVLVEYAMIYPTN